MLRSPLFPIIIEDRVKKRRLSISATKILCPEPSSWSLNPKTF